MMSLCMTLFRTTILRMISSHASTRPYACESPSLINETKQRQQQSFGTAATRDGHAFLLYNLNFDTALFGAFARHEAALPVGKLKRIHGFFIVMLASIGCLLPLWSRSFAITRRELRGRETTTRFVPPALDT